MDDEPIILLLYVDDLFLTKKWEIDHKNQEEASRKIKDERYWIDALFYRPRSVVEPKRNIFELGKVCYGNIKKI